MCGTDRGLTLLLTYSCRHGQGANSQPCSQFESIPLQVKA